MARLRTKANRAVRKAVGLAARLSRGRLVNIGSIGKGVSAVLSNLTKAPFVLDGVKWASFEGFWQGIRFPEGQEIRNKAQLLWGLEAYRLKKEVRTSCLYYGGREIPYGSRALYELAKRAERARFQQNPDQLQSLLSTGNAKLVHIVELRDSKSLPRKVFCKILTELREEFRKEK